MNTPPSTPSNPSFAPAQRAILRLLQREPKIQLASLSVRIRPSFGDAWRAALDDLIDRGIVREYGEVIKRNGGRTRSVVMYEFTDDSYGDHDFMKMAPEAIDDWISSASLQDGFQQQLA